MQLVTIKRPVEDSNSGIQLDCMYVYVYIYTYICSTLARNACFIKDDKISFLTTENENAPRGIPVILFLTFLFGI